MSEAPLYVGAYNLLGVKHDPPATYKGTSLIRNTPLLGPYSRTIPRIVW